MEGFEQFSRVGKVKAPEDFEARVLARLPGETRLRLRRRTAARYAFGGAAAVAVAGSVLLGVFVLPKRPPVALAGKPSVQKVVQPIVSAGLAPGRRGDNAYVPMLEKVDYTSEYRNVSHEPKTVLILEQVSEGAPSGVRF